MTSRQDVEMAEEVDHTEEEGPGGSLQMRSGEDHGCTQRLGKGKGFCVRQD